MRREASLDAVAPLLGTWRRAQCAAFFGDASVFVFGEGMEFGAELLWWNGRARRSLHEGVDFCMGRAAGGELVHVASGAAVLSVAAGSVRAVFGDFIGETVVVRHPQWASDGCCLHTIFGHTQSGVPEGASVGPGDAIGVVAPSRTSAPSHLHLSLAWLREDAPVRGWRDLAALEEPCGFLRPPMDVPLPGEQAVAGTAAADGAPGRAR